MSAAPPDLPEGFVVDEAAPPSVEAEELTLEGILREAGCLAPAVRPLTAHEAAVQSFLEHVPMVSSSGRLQLEVADPFGAVVAWAGTLASRDVGPSATWVRFIRSDLRCGALFVASTPDAHGSADLLAMAEPGVIGRGLLADVSKWLFLGLGLSKVTAHVPVGRADLSDLLRRAGFVFEGVSRGYFHGEGDASRWSMLARDCRWLSPRARPRPAIPPANILPPPSLKVH